MHDSTEDNFRRTYFPNRKTPRAAARIALSLNIGVLAVLGPTLYLAASEIRAWIDSGLHLQQDTASFFIAPRWLTIPPDDAYLWLTVSAVLIITLSTVYGLRFDKGPKIRSRYLHGQYKKYRKRLEKNTKRLMQATASYFAAIGMIVALCGAADYILNPATGEAHSQAVERAVVLLSVAVLVVLVVGMLRSTSWVYPLGLGPLKISKYAAGISAALDYCGLGKNGQGFFRRTSIYWLVLLVPAIDTYIFVLAATLQVAGDVLPLGMWLSLYTNYLVLTVALVAIHTVSFYLRVSARFVRCIDSGKRAILIRLVSYLLALPALFVIATSLLILPIEGLLIGLWFIAVTCLLTSIKKIWRFTIPSFGVRARVVTRLKVFEISSRKSMTHKEYDKMLDKAGLLKRVKKPSTLTPTAPPCLAATDDSAEYGTS